jgi:MFS family permease
MATDAGWGAVSFVSVLAGVLVAAAAAELLILAAWAVAAGMNVDTTMSDQEWRRLGELGGIGTAIVLFLAFAYGGYAAGRMARRGGLRNGVLVAIVGIALAVGIGAAAGALGGWGPITREVHRLGAPSTWREWRYPALVTGIASIVAVFLGAVGGGRLGERWHSKLLARALDPRIGPEAEARAAAALPASHADDVHRAAASRVAKATASREPVVVTTEPFAEQEPATAGTPDVSGPATVSGVRAGDRDEVRQEAEPRS